MALVHGYVSPHLPPYDGGEEQERKCVSRAPVSEQALGRASLLRGPGTGPSSRKQEASSPSLRASQSVPTILTETPSLWNVGYLSASDLSAKQGQNRKKIPLDDLNII